MELFLTLDPPLCTPALTGAVPLILAVNALSVAVAPEGGFDAGGIHVAQELAVTARAKLRPLVPTTGAILGGTGNMGGG